MARGDAWWWLALLLGAAAAVAGLYPLAFPFAPDDWLLTRDQAIALVEARLPDVVDAPAAPYVTARLDTDAALELRLAEAPRGAHQRLRASNLAQRKAVWRVSVYERSSPVGEWSALAEVALDGELLSLIRGTPPAFASTAIVEEAEARRRARDFLTEQGLDVALFAEPTVRRVDLGRFAYLYLRYSDLESLALQDVLGGADYGIEVRFAGDQLEGFYTWLRDPRGDALGRELGTARLVATAQGLLVFLFVPVLGALFVRRYHEGLVAVRRAAQLGAVVLGVWSVVLVQVARSAAEGNALANLTRPQTTWALTALAIIVYVPALSAATFMACALGESRAQGVWRRRLTSFDAVCRGAFDNAAVAASSLRGVALGVSAVAATLLVLVVLARFGVHATFAQLVGPGWESARFPGLALLGVTTGFGLLYLCFGVLFLVPWLVERWGAWLGASAAAIFAGLAFLPALVVVPIGAAMPLAIALAAVPVVVFLRWDLLGAGLALLTTWALLMSLPLIDARAPALVVQGWLVPLAITMPLWASLRWLGTSRLYSYTFDDVPPHVRRIAERERHRVEIETARSIQGAILPPVPDRLAGARLAHAYLAATEIGGDFFLVEELGASRLAVAVGDVAGHGVSSGLIMSMARAALTVQLAVDPGVERVMETLNRVIYGAARRRLLTTLCYAVIDTGRGVLRMASAGHLYPYRVAADGHVDVLESTAYPLGVRETLQIETREVVLVPGDCIFFASDGLVEFRRLGGEEPFGFERLERSLARAGGRGAAALRDAVLHDLERFIGSGTRVDLESCARDDDLTVLVVQIEDVGQEQ